MESALQRLIRFLLIVWTITGAFIVLNAALLRIGQQIVQSWVISLSTIAPIADAAAATPATACNAVVEQQARVYSNRAMDPRVTDLAAGLAWRMGFEVGVWGAGPIAAGRLTADKAPAFLERAANIAKILQSPMPVLPSVKHSVKAFGEFGEYIEDDPQCVAAYLGRRFSPQHAALFKFGEALGFSTYYRIVIAEGGTAFGSEIARYGTEAELPKALWADYARESKRELPGTDAPAKLNSVIKQFSDYFTCKRERAKGCEDVHGGK